MKMITGKQRAARRRNIKVAQSARKRAGSAFKKAYKETMGYGSGKATALRRGHSAAIKASPRAGTKMAKTYARGVAKKKYSIKSKRGQDAFARGYTKPF